MQEPHDNDPGPHNETSFEASQFLNELRLAKEAKLLENHKLRERIWEEFLDIFWIVVVIYVFAAIVWLLFSIYYHQHQKKVCRQKHSEYSLTEMLERQRLLHLYNNVSIRSQGEESDNENARSNEAR